MSTDSRPTLAELEDELWQVVSLANFMLEKYRGGPWEPEEYQAHWTHIRQTAVRARNVLLTGEARGVGGPAVPANIRAGVVAYLDWKARGDSSPANLVHAILGAIGGAVSREPSEAAPREPLAAVQRLTVEQILAVRGAWDAEWRNPSSTYDDAAAAFRDALLKELEGVRAVEGEAAPPAGPWRILTGEDAADWEVEEGDAIVVESEADGRNFVAANMAEALAVRDALNRVSGSAEEAEL